MTFEKVLTKNIGKENSTSIETYLAAGGYKALEKALAKRPEEIVEEVKASQLRGRGGAGFPMGVKWSFLPKETDKPVYLCCNADESEPGTFKDRVIIEGDPHLLLEGIAISSYAIGSRQAFIYIRGEMAKGYGILEEAIAEAKGQGFLGERIMGSSHSLDVGLFRGGGAYICGEETALLESAEGRRGYPRLKPPFPASVGLFASPTIVNNVETLACVPSIVERGAEWFRSMGKKNNTGPKLFCVSGHVNNPGVFELPMGTPLKEVIYKHAGGIRGGRKLKAFFPGGSSVPVLTGEEVDVDGDFDSLQKAGSMFGSAGIIVMDETTCMVKVALNLAEFYAHESCGQCTPCREGTRWMVNILGKIEAGAGMEGDGELLIDVCDNIFEKTVCPLGDAAALPIASIVKKFKSEFDDHIREGRCPYGNGETRP